MNNPDSSKQTIIIIFTNRQNPNKKQLISEILTKIWENLGNKVKTAKLNKKKLFFFGILPNNYLDFAIFMFGFPIFF
jgi:hypothetical protein